MGSALGSLPALQIEIHSSASAGRILQSWRIHFSSAQAHFSEDGAAASGRLWVQRVLPALSGPRVAPALSLGAWEGPREKAPGYRGEGCLYLDRPAF